MRLPSAFRAAALALALLGAAPEAAAQVTTTAELVAAVGAASAGDTVRVAAGTYEIGAPLRLKSGMALLGAGRDATVIEGAASWDPGTADLPDTPDNSATFNRDAYLIDLGDGNHGVTIAGLTLRGPRLHGAIVGNDPDRLEVRDCRIENVLWSGIRTLGMGFGRIHGNEFTDAGGRFGNRTGGALYFVFFPDTEIWNNTIRRSPGSTTRVMGIKGEGTRRTRIHHNTIDTRESFAIELPFRNYEAVEIDHNVMSGVVSVPKQSGGTAPATGLQFDIHHNVFTSTYAIEWPRNGSEVHHNLFRFDPADDGGNLLASFDVTAAPGPTRFYENRVLNPGRGVFWAEGPSNNVEVANNHIIATPTVTPRDVGLFGFDPQTDFSTVAVRDNVIEVRDLPRPLFRNGESYGATVENNLLTGLSDGSQYANPQTGAPQGPQDAGVFLAGAFESYSVDGFDYAFVGPPAQATLDGTSGYRMLAWPGADTYDSFLGGLWTQGFPGSDASGEAFCSVYAFDETRGSFAGGYTCLADQAGANTRGSGLFAYVYEDDDLVASGVQGGFPKTLTFSGAAAAPFSVFPITYTDAASSPAYQEGWNLLGNPLREAFDWDLAERSGGLSGSIYVYDPAYLGGDYRTWSAGLGGDLPEGVVPAFQGFYAQAFSATAALAIPPEAVVGAGQEVYGATGAAPEASGVAKGSPAPLRLELSLDGDPVSVAFVALAPEAALGLDARDAVRLRPLAWPRTVLSTMAVEGGEPVALALNALPAVARGEVLLPLVAAAEGHARAEVPLALSWSGGLDGWTAALVDRYAGREIALAEPGTYSFALGASGGSGDAPLGLNVAPERAREAKAPRDRNPMSSADRFALRLTPAVTVDAPEAPSHVFGLGAPVPNPVRGTLRVPFSLAEPGEARVAVYDALGREVAVVAEGVRGAGNHTATVETGGLAPGVYAVRLRVEGASASRRVTVAR